MNQVTSTLIFRKVGSAYATDDSRYRLTKRNGTWTLHGPDHEIMRYRGLSKADALRLATEIVCSHRGCTVPKDSAPEMTADDLPWDDTFDMAAEGFWHADANGSNCSVCAKTIKDANHSNGVCLVGGGATACRPADYYLFEKYDGGAVLGVYPVGPECIKKIPAEFRYTR